MIVRVKPGASRWPVTVRPDGEDQVASADGKPGMVRPSAW